nr:trehalose-phosphatase [Dissulfurirhabdus thermomarina]
MDTGLEPEAFWSALRRAPARGLFLDYDGTLAPFRVERDRAVPYPGVREALAEILRGGGTRLVVVSGRAVADLLPLLALDRPVEIWGAHGFERLRPDGRHEVQELPPALRNGLDAARRWAAEHLEPERFEEKPGCLAVHWRGLPADAARALEGRVREAWTPVAREAGLALRPFDGGLELRSPGWTKGSVVERLLAEMAPGAAAAYLGDDDTDEDAFRALGPGGLSVLVRDRFRPTRARLWIRPPAELLDFLGRWACETGTHGGDR